MSNQTPTPYDEELNKIIESLLEDHIDMYSQDRDSSAALGADIEATKAKLKTLIDRQVAEARRDELLRLWEFLKQAKVHDQDSAMKLSYMFKQRSAELLQAEYKEPQDG